MTGEKTQVSSDPLSEPSATLWRAYEQMYNFLGSELLTPMNRSGNTQGLDAAFWNRVPQPENAAGRKGLARLQDYALQASAAEAEGSDSRTDVPGMLAASVEYTHLFIGPPSPAACPWETASDPRNENKVGYGRSTVAMQRLLAEEGLQLDNENRQYEDHIGIELLYLAVLSNKMAVALEGARSDIDSAETVRSLAAKAGRFVQEHPLAWIGHLREDVDKERPKGYYSALLEYTQGLLESHAAVLSTY